MIPADATVRVLPDHAVRRYQLSWSKDTDRNISTRNRVIRHLWLIHGSDGRKVKENGLTSLTSNFNSVDLPAPTNTSKSVTPSPTSLDERNARPLLDLTVGPHQRHTTIQVNAKLDIVINVGLNCQKRRRANLSMTTSTQAPLNATRRLSIQHQHPLQKKLHVEQGKRAITLTLVSA